MRVSYVVGWAIFGAVLLFGCGRDNRHRTNVGEERTTSPAQEVQRVGGSDRAMDGGAGGSGSTSPSPTEPVTARDGGMGGDGGATP